MIEIDEYQLMEDRPHGKNFTVRLERLRSGEIRALIADPPNENINTWLDEFANINIDELNAPTAYEIDLPESDGSFISEAENYTRTIKMGDIVKRPDPLDVNGNVSESWRRFKRNWEIFLEAADIAEKPDKIKINTLLNCVGADAVDVYDTLPLSNAERESYAEVVKALEAFCSPKKNEVYERFLFYQRKQKEGEPFDQFHIDIKRLARTCGFQERENEMLRDRIVLGVIDKRLQQRLLETRELTYDIAVEKIKGRGIERAGK